MDFVSQYKGISFSSEDHFKLWLDDTAYAIIEFEDHGQDLIKIWVDEYGEIINAYMQYKFWLGRFINIEIAQSYYSLYIYDADYGMWRRIPELIVKDVNYVCEEYEEFIMNTNQLNK